MKKGKLSQEFQKFQKNEKIKVEELQKVSGGTCIFYSSASQSDCDKDDQTYSYRDGRPWDIDKTPIDPSDS